jgi:2-polyprenyl-6-methoxyphenol hydroxylase-like FAD-dependent oxidoreductase
MSGRSAGGDPPRALVVGAGMGGMAAAIALRRIGVDATVFERAGDVRKIEAGGGYSMWHGGMCALRELGLLERAAAVGGPIERFEYGSAGGAPLAEWPVGELGRRRFGAAPIGIMRPDLHRIFAGAVGEEAVVYGAACTGFSQDEHGVRAQFADGREERGALLVGADGLESVVRGQLLGEAPVRPSGYAHWFGFLDLEPESELTPHGTFRILYGRGSRFAFLPISRTRLCWWCTVPAAQAAARPGAAVKAWLLEHFRGWAFPVEAVIDATAEPAIARRDTFDRPPARTWGAGRVTLLGDAAHPMTFNVGQGAGTALKDGVMLAKYLAAAGGRDIPSALRAYESRRMGTTRKLTRVSRAVGAAAAWQSPLASGLHASVLRRSRRPVVRVMELDTDFSMPGAVAAR